MLFYIAHGCPNCGGLISDERLSLGLPCERCLSAKTLSQKTLSFEEVIQTLEKNKKLKELKVFGRVEGEVHRFNRIFQEIFGVKPSSLQLSWAKRFFLGESFAIVAPTGTGKTTFGLLSCLLNPERSLILVPTKVLVNHLYERLQDLQEKTSSEELRVRRILSYTGSNQEKRLLEEKDFDIFICTQAFFHRNYELLKKADFSLVFVDDVDSFLKSGKNVEHLFYMLGFSQREIELALKREKEEEDFERLWKIKERHSRKLKRLIVSSATLKPKTSRAILFQNLLGFEITRFVSSLRKVEDLYMETDSPTFEALMEKAYEVVKKIGPGGLLFVEEGAGREGVERVTNYLKEKGLKVVSYLEEKEGDLLELLKEREIDLAIGLAHLANPLLRGLDLPFALHYVLFLGVPKHFFPLGKKGETLNLPLSTQFLHNLLLNLLPLFEEEERFRALSYINYLKRYLTLREENLTQYEGIVKKVTEIRNFLQERLLNEAFMERLKESDEVFLDVREDGGYYVVVGNAQVYLQGSGRVSRLTARGLLPGISLVLLDHPKAFVSLKKRLRFYLGEEAEFQKVSPEEIPEINQKILEERNSLQESPLDFKNYLIIVESPHKAKTIASFFGKPARRRLKNLWVYEIPMEGTLLSVCASLGHLFNLSRKEGLFGVLPEKGHYYPLFDTIKLGKSSKNEIVDEDTEEEGELYDKGEIIRSLRTLAYCATETFIASDPDSEGEKIAYDLYINLRPFQKNIKRIEFHEVTPRAFRRALEEAGPFNLPRVKAQLARRVADRWVGFSLSRELWAAFKKRNLSAGRVQTPVLGWVIKRAEEAKLHKYRLTFTLSGFPFALDFEEKELAERVLEGLAHLKIDEITPFEEELSPPPPYTTDSILEEAYYYFRFPSSQCMSLLQELFELGLITYHRTDSTRVSETGRYRVAKPYLEQNLGEGFFYPREWSSAGAHEGIRPTYPWDVKELKLRVAHGLLTFKNPKDSLRLYDLIFRRFMASQCKPILLKKGIFRFSVPGYSWEETLNLQILESGFDLLWMKPQLFNLQESSLPENPELKAVPKVFLFNQGSLIQEMKKRGLGRPSTYAEILATLLQRYYVYELKNGSLVPTALGKKVYSYLTERFQEYISEDFTRELEEFMDAVERGEKEWEEICHKLKPLLDLTPKISF
jgi:reverse gyrase